MLDFGCGAGRTLRHFLEEAESGTFYGCDIDAPSIAWLEANLSPPLHVFANGEEPPLPLEAESLDLIWAISVFTHISDHWAAWLVELHRLLRNDGLLHRDDPRALPLGRVDRGGAGSEGRPGRSAGGRADRIGMNVLHHGRSWDQGGPAVFLSEWWVKEHWGRAFEILTLREEGFAAIPPDWRGQGVCWPGSVRIESRRGAREDRSRRSPRDRGAPAQRPAAAPRVPEGAGSRGLARGRARGAIVGSALESAGRSRA